MATRNLASNMDKTSNRVVAFFSRREDAYRALSDLKQAGFNSDQIGLAVGHEEEERSGDATSMRESRGATSTREYDSSFWQRVKDFFSGEDHHDRTDFGDVAGPMGWTDDRYEYYQRGISSGGAVLTVTGDRISEARSILQRDGADLRESGFESDSSARSMRASGLSGTQGERRIQLRGERLRTHKERVQRGEVRLRKDVVTETQNVQVPVTREELVIERTPGSGQVTGEIGRDQEIRVPLSEERVRVEKQPVVNEEVRVGKRQVQSNQQVSDKVRHEELRVEKEGNVDAPERNAPGNRKNRVA
jgi:uncharacterized protein (TIGR02271 family)